MSILGGGSGGRFQAQWPTWAEKRPTRQMKEVRGGRVADGQSAVEDYSGALISFLYCLLMPIFKTVMQAIALSCAGWVAKAI